jgi:hypothetical protein
MAAYGSRKKRKKRKQLRRAKPIVMSAEAKERAIKKWDERDRKEMRAPGVIVRTEERPPVRVPRATFVSGGSPSLGKRR